jgi:hypothetical protein
MTTVPLRTVPVKYDPSYSCFGIVDGPVERPQHPNQQRGLNLYVKVINNVTGEECLKKLYRNKTGLHFKHTGYPPTYIDRCTARGHFIPYQFFPEGSILFCPELSALNNEEIGT